MSTNDRKASPGKSGAGVLSVVTAVQAPGLLGGAPSKAPAAIRELVLAGAEARRQEPD